MKIITKRQALYRKKSAVNVWYYLRKEYEVHYNEQFVKSTQTWHHHRRVAETLYILAGPLLLKWIAKGKLHKRIVRTGDLVETGREPHTFINKSNQTARFIVIKQILTGKNKRKILKSDKFVDQPPA